MPTKPGASCSRSRSFNDQADGSVLLLCADLAQSVQLSAAGKRRCDCTALLNQQQICHQHATVELQQAAQQLPQHVVCMLQISRHEPALIRDREPLVSFGKSLAL